MIRIRCTNPEKQHSHCYSLLAGEEYRIGRKAVAPEPDEKYIMLAFPEDGSISRNHAKIEVEHPMANTTDALLTPSVVITDLGSKFGTFANDGIEKRAKLAMREGMSLCEGDKFKFGLQWNEYKIEYTKLIVTASSLRNDTTLKLRKQIMALGGHLVNDWEKNVDYLVMDTLSLTIKAVCAILGAKWIVTPAFFDDWVDGLRTQSQGKASKPPPNPLNFLPPLAETGLQGSPTFEPVEGRKELFKGKTFVFCTSKQMKKLSAPIEAGGGKCKLIVEIQNKDFLKENILLMKPSDRDLIIASGETKEALDAYSKRKRPIQDSELGLAAVYMSCDKHCNPYHIFGGGEKEGSRLPTQSQSSEMDPSIVSATQISEAETQRSEAGDTNRSRVQATYIDLEEEEDRKDVKVKRELKKDHKEGPPSKKRPAEEALPGTSARASREKRPRNFATSTQKSPVKSQGGLSAVFGFSDDEDEDDMIPGSDDDDNIITAAPVTRRIDTDDDEDVIVPETQRQRRSQNPGPSSSMAAVAVATEEHSFKVPEPRTRSHRTRVESSPSPEKSPEKSNGNLSMSTTGKKRKHQSTPETSPVKVGPPKDQSQTSTRKTKKTKGNETSPVKIEVEKITVKPDVKKILFEEELLHAPRFHEIIVPMLNRVPKIVPKVEVINGKQVKNFKTFKKVLPLSMQRLQLNETLNSSASTTISRSTTSSKKSNKNYKKMAYEIVDFSPRTVLQYKTPNLNVTSDGKTFIEIQEPMILRISDNDENEMEIEDVMPDVDTSRLRGNIPGPSRVQARQTPRTIVPAPTTLAIATTTSATTKQRRKEKEEEAQVDRPTTARETRSTRSITKPPVKIIDSDDDDDDMFQFH